MWFGGAREIHWATSHNQVTSSKTKEFLKSPEISLPSFRTQDFLKRTQINVKLECSAWKYKSARSNRTPKSKTPGTKNYYDRITVLIKTMFNRIQMFKFRIKTTNSYENVFENSLSGENKLLFSYIKYLTFNFKFFSLLLILYYLDIL